MQSDHSEQSIPADRRATTPARFIELLVRTPSLKDGMIFITQGQVLPLSGRLKPVKKKPTEAGGQSSLLVFS